MALNKNDLRQFESHLITHRNESCEFNVPKRYQSLKYKNAGAQGWVVSAVDSVTRRRVAIKKLRAPFVMEHSALRTYREFVLLSSFAHPNIIQLLNAFTPQQSPNDFTDIYLVMELADFNLAEVIHDKRLPHRHLSFLVFQLLQAMKHLHHSGIIHRDLKPENVVVNEDVTLKILDFGLARKASFDTQMRMTNYVVTRWYRSPEIILEIPYSEKADVWSIGCILAELLLSKVLFRGSDHLDQWHSIVRTLGTPPDSFIDRAAPSVRMFIRSRPATPAKAMSQIIPLEKLPTESEERRHGLTNANALDLITKMLIYDPEVRISVDDALKHPYVSGWLQGHSIDLPPIDYDDSLESPGTSIAQWKEILFNKLREYSTSHDIFGVRPASTTV